MSNQRSQSIAKSASSKRKKASLIYESVMPKEDLNVFDQGLAYDSMLEQETEQAPADPAPIESLKEAVRAYGEEVNALIMEKLATMDANLGESEFLREMRDYILDCLREKQLANATASAARIDQLILASKRFSLQRGEDLRSLLLAQPQPQALRRGSNNSLATFFEESCGLLGDCSRLLKLHVKRMCKQLKLFSKYDKRGLLEAVHSDIDAYRETVELFWDEQTEDPNYIKREKLLYDPVVAIPDLKPRDNVIFYYERFAEVHRQSTFRRSRLFRPLALFSGEAGKQPGECRVELSGVRYREMMAAVGVAGLDFPGHSFSKQHVVEAFQASLSGLGEAKELAQRLPSGFTQQFLARYVAAFVVQNFDLHLHQQHVLAMDSILKLQALTIMHLCSLLFQGKQSYSYTRLRDYFLQKLVLEVRHLLALARQVYRQLAERVDQYSQPPDRKTVSEKGLQLLQALHRTANNHMREDTSDPNEAADSALFEDAPLGGLALTAEGLVRTNFGRLLELEQLLLRVMSI